MSYSPTMIAGKYGKMYRYCQQVQTYKMTKDGFIMCKITAEQ